MLHWFKPFTMKGVCAFMLVLHAARATGGGPEPWGPEIQVEIVAAGPADGSIADGGFEEPPAVGNATYCDAGGDVACSHTLPARPGELVVGFQAQSPSTNKGRSFETHYADTFNATGTAPLHSCTLGQQDGAKIGVRVGATRRASIASRSARRRTPCNLDQ